MAMAGLSAHFPSPFPIGQPIVIVPEENGEPAYRREEYTSRIEDVLHEELVVSSPMRRRVLVDFPVDSPVSAYFNRSGARYRFEGTVKSSSERPFPVLHLSNLRRLERQERRAHARANAIIEPTRLSVAGEDGAERERKLGFVVNLSAGGLGLICRRPLPVGALLEVSLELPRGFGQLEARAEVVRSRGLRSGCGAQWQVGARLIDICPRDRDRVASFVLQQQQSLRRRGLM